VPARPVYSELLGRSVNPAPGLITLGTVPAGYRWVVKDMVAYCGQVFASPVAGFDVEDTVGGILWAVRHPWAVAGHTYHWNGGQVVDTFESLYFRVTGATWSVRVSGYVLTLP
jgi:hypothetical protein